MPVRNASAEWNGSIMEGDGHMRFGSGAFDGRYSFGSRFQEEPGTNPEELIGAALAGCFSMALSGNLGRAGFAPESIRTNARVTVEKSGDGFTISRIDLETTGRVPGIDADAFQREAEKTKVTCPVSRLYRGAEINMTATLER